MTYTFECRECGEIFEVKATLAEKEEFNKEKFKCPTCGSHDVGQIITPPNVCCGSGDLEDSCCQGCSCGH